MRLMKYILSISLIELILFLSLTSPVPPTTVTPIEERMIDIILDPIIISYDTLRKSIEIPVTITKYNPVKSQCNSDPTLTADNSRIDLNLLKSYELRWIAVSRNLLDKVSMGDTITVVSSNHRINGDWVVHDVMNKRFSDYIDLLVPEEDEYQLHEPLKGSIQIYVD